EISAFLGVFIYSEGMPTETFLNFLPECFWLQGHKIIGLLKAHAGGVISSGPGIVQRGLVTSKVDVNSFPVKSFPNIYHIAQVGDRNRFFVFDRFSGPGDQRRNFLNHFINPSLGM